MPNLVVTTEEALRQLVADQVAEGVRRALDVTQSDDQPDELAIVPARLYTAADANRLLGFKRMTIYEIPETDLPRCRVGPARGSLRFLGADLVAYAKGVPVADTQALVDGARAELRDRLSKPSVVAGAVGMRTQAPQSSRRRIV